jgi:hypothetical protein
VIGRRGLLGTGDGSLETRTVRFALHDQIVGAIDEAVDAFWASRTSSKVAIHSEVSRAACSVAVSGAILVADGSWSAEP